MMSHPQRAGLALLLAGLASLSACSAPHESSPSTDSSPTIVTSFYPLAWLAEEIGGEYYHVTSLTPTGVEPHEYELSPRDITTMESAELIVYVEGFQPSFDDAAEEMDGAAILDLAPSLALIPFADEGDMGDDAGESHSEDEHSLGAFDPHFWLDPTRMAAAADALTEELATADPAHRESYEEARAGLIARLNSLHAAMQKQLSTCEYRDLVSAHAAFGYLATTYSLEAWPIALDAESEPSPARIAELTEHIRQTSLPTIFAEAQAPASSIEALASETGATVMELSTLEQAPDEGGYIEAMEANLAALAEGLHCG